MSRDLIERLRAPDRHDPACPFKKHCYCDDGAPHDSVQHPHALEAADEIERLRAELSSLRGEGEGSDVIGRLVREVRAFMPTGISYSNPNIPDDVMIPLDVTMGELRAINAALASIPSTEGGGSLNGGCSAAPR